MSTLEALCRKLQCQPGDILEYVPGPQGDRKRPRPASRIYNKIKEHYGTMKKDFLTVTELCQYWKLDFEMVNRFLEG